MTQKRKLSSENSTFFQYDNTFLSFDFAKLKCLLKALHSKRFSFTIEVKHCSKLHCNVFYKKKTYAIQTVLEIALKVLFLGKKTMTL